MGLVQNILTSFVSSRQKRKLENDQQDESQEEKSKPDWKKVKAERKELRQQRKKAGGAEDRYELGVKAKQVWEELRRGNCGAARRTQLSQELLGLVRGQLGKLVRAHDTARVLETLVGVGGEEVREAVWEELQHDLIPLCKDRYAHFFVLKMLRQGSKEQRGRVMAALHGRVVRLMQHRVASQVVELAYNDYANAAQRSAMMQEFYGPHFRLFKEEGLSSLGEALARHPERREAMVEEVRRSLQPILDKGVFTNSMVHTLLRDYLTHCGAGRRPAVVEALRERLAPIVHTRDGARVAMLCLWHGSPKDRKFILRSLKTHFAKLAMEEHGHMVLLAAFDCVDDTVFVRKAVLAELMEDLDQLVGSSAGLRVLRYLVAPRHPTFFHPDVLRVLAEGDGNAASKKEAAVRQRELQEGVAAPILRLLLGNLQFWATNPSWTLFIGAALRTLHCREREAILDALALLCAQPYVPGGEGHVLEVAHTVKMLTFLLRCDPEHEAAGRPTFGPKLLRTVGQEAAGWINCNRGCFLLATMLEHGSSPVRSEVTRLLSPFHDKLATLSCKGAEVLLKQLAQQDTDTQQDDADTQQDDTDAQQNDTDTLED